MHLLGLLITGVLLLALRDKRGRARPLLVISLVLFCGQALLHQNTLELWGLMMRWTSLGADPCSAVVDAVHAVLQVAGWVALAATVVTWHTVAARRDRRAS